jgi:hypothetical protein
MGNQESSTSWAALPTQLDPCHKLACKIQTCLEHSNYQQDRCNTEREAYNNCVKLRTEKEWDRQKKEEKRTEGPESKNKKQ